MLQWVGDACGRHGSYVFYKAFQFSPFKPAAPAASSSSVLVRTRTRDRRNTLSDSDITKPAADRNNEVDDNAAAEPTYDRRILSLGEFFFVQCRPEDPVCIGELQLLWHDKHSGQDLSSTRLYYLPETTPAGRSTHHGQVGLKIIWSNFLNFLFLIDSWAMKLLIKFWMSAISLLCWIWANMITQHFELRFQHSRSGLLLWDLFTHKVKNKLFSFISFHLNSY